MTRVSLQKYFEAIFKENKNKTELFKKINSTHAISSRYHDVQFGRETLMYRDKENQIVLQIDHRDEDIVVYISGFLEFNECPIIKPVLQNRIGTILNFLDVKFKFV